MRTKVKNLTPHPINILDVENNIIKSYPSEGLIRLKQTTVDAGFTIDGCKITKTVFGEPEGLPEYENGIFYIVSQIVKNALPERGDLLVPSEVIRNKEGNIIGCKSLGL